ncbi:hypothetical protein ACL03H_02495 [Saccharopolyspora sp. MS10]|uniref:hypothetical protein n=1 Tax=Saccharopolyspora sp. MS10 TaxID=3385973 RepID=UPI0039A1BD65
MRSVPRLPLLIAALLLPVAAVLIGYAATNEPRNPEVPVEVHVGDMPGPGPILRTSPPAELPPPEPEDATGDAG